MRALVELLVPSVCPGCDAPRREGEPLLCGPCTTRLQPAPQRGVRCAFVYRGTALRLIQRLKFEGRRDALAVLVPALAERVGELPFDGIVPVPRHPRRVREQDGDPVWEIARRLARELGRPLLARALQRVRYGRPQMELPRAERLRNPRGAFRARSGALVGRRVLLLDDVITTGATLGEAARALRAARPTAVYRSALAAAPPGVADAL